MLRVGDVMDGCSLAQMDVQDTQETLGLWQKWKFEFEHNNIKCNKTDCTYNVK